MTILNNVRDSDVTLPMLKEIAKELGVGGYSKLRKPELLKTLREVQDTDKFIVDFVHRRLRELKYGEATLTVLDTMLEQCDEDARADLLYVLKGDYRYDDAVYEVIGELANNLLENDCYTNEVCESLVSIVVDNNLLCVEVDEDYCSVLFVGLTESDTSSNGVAVVSLYSKVHSKPLPEYIKSDSMESRYGTDGIEEFERVSDEVLTYLLQLKPQLLGTEIIHYVNKLNN